MNFMICFSIFILMSFIIAVVFMCMCGVYVSAGAWIPQCIYGGMTLRSQFFPSTMGSEHWTQSMGLDWAMSSVLMIFLFMWKLALEFIEITLNLVAVLGHTAIYTILILPVHARGEIPPPTSIFFHFFFQWFEIFYCGHLLSFFVTFIQRCLWGYCEWDCFQLFAFSIHLLLL